MHIHFQAKHYVSPLPYSECKVIKCMDKNFDCGGYLLLNLFWFKNENCNVTSLTYSLVWDSLMPATSVIFLYVFMCHWRVQIGQIRSFALSERASIPSTLCLSFFFHTEVQVSLSWAARNSCSVQAYLAHTHPAVYMSLPQPTPLPHTVPPHSTVNAKPLVQKIPKL